ncbi:MAG TPA: hypothetical protein VFB22_13740 [Candidatus Baltobacteraceae bacterium]|nr:hypothetical protein [Candidatus Baltobacteraceae bacterium]
MRTPYLTAAVAFAALLAPFAAGAAPKPFTGPAGWNHTVTATPSPTSPRSAESWQKGDQNVSALNSTDVVYGDVVAAVHKNMAGNNVHPTVDRDITCAGKPAHELEMTLNGTTFHQLIIDEGTGGGTTRITYSRPQSMSPAPDVTAAFTAYCGS